MPRLYCLLLLAATALAGRGESPNVVVLLGDDQGWGDYGFMGSKVIATPHLDKFAAQSLVFPRGYVPSSLCRPSLASIVTGRFPHEHGITTNDPAYPPNLPPAQRMKDKQYLADRAAMVATFNKSPHLATLLGAKGYVSFQSGKWWEGEACRCGFTEAMSHGDPARGGRHGDEGLKIGREGLKPVFEFLDKSKASGKPFYLWYAPMMPHTPHNPPERLLAKYKPKTPSIHVAKYWAMCEWFDETIGELLAKLESNGQSKNTIVVYLHDNGWIQNPNAAVYADKSKQSPYDGGLRTPIAVRWPGKVAPGRSEALAHSIDIVPTILKATGTEAPAGLPGIDLLDSVATSKRDTIFGEIFLHTAKDIHSPKANLRYRWVVHGTMKLIVPDAVNSPTDGPELYDLAADPTETKNLAKVKPDTVADLAKRLDAWWPAK